MPSWAKGGEQVMLTTVNGMLASHNWDPTFSENGWSQFVDRLTDDRFRLVVTVFTTVIVLGIIWWKLPKFRLLAIVIAMVAGWAAWGIVNLLASPYPQPLFILPIELDFYSLFQGYNWLLLAIPLFGFVAVLSKKRSFGRLILAGLVAAGLTIVVLLGQQAWRQAELQREQGEPIVNVGN